MTKEVYDPKPIKRLNELELNDREREIARAIILEVCRIYLEYKSLARDYRRKEGVTAHNARVMARRLIYETRIKTI